MNRHDRRKNMKLCNPVGSPDGPPYKNDYPRIRMSKKQRIKQRWEGRVRFAKGEKNES